MAMFPQAKSKEDKGPPPHFVHEGMVDVDKPQQPTSSRFTMYDRTTRVRSDVFEKCMRVGSQAKKLSSVFPKLRGCYKIADEKA